MHAYPRYRNSGVEWLGELPEHWELTQLRRAVRLKAGEGITSEEIEEAGDYPVFGGNGTRGYTASYTHEGEFVLIGRQGALCGNIHVARGKFWASEHAVVATPASEISVAWLGHTLDMMRLNQYSDAAAQPGLALERIRSLPFPLPPLDEQRAIAAYLDRETERIDALVAKKRLLIERLEEYRTALITRTVTRGLPPEAARAASLDPSPRLKPSGVEWLGEVPEHWEVKRLKQVAHVRYGLAEPPPEDPEGIPILRATNVKSGKIHTEGMLHVGAEDVPNGRNAFLKAGEILVVRSGAYTGDSSIVPSEYEGAVAGYDIVVRVLNGFPGFVAWQILGPTVLKAQFHLRSMRAAQQHLNAEDIGETWITCPPSREQRVLSSYLDGAASQIDAVMAQTREAIERSQEYRTALITSAVTGKIDVRE